MTGPALQRVLDALTNAGREPQPTSNGYQARCPTHDDHRPSLSIHNGAGKVLLECKAACPTDQVLADLELTWPELYDDHYQPAVDKPRVVATYDYVDDNGVLLYQKLRYEPKTFRIRHRGPNGEWVWRIGDQPKVLYRLPQLAAAVAEGAAVYVVEGEKDVDNLAALGLVGTCNYDGAGKWRPEYNTWFTGAHVVIIADNDAPGYAHAEHIAEQLAPVAAIVTQVRGVVDTHGADVTDHLEAGHGIDDLVPLDAPAPDPAYVRDVAREVHRLRVRDAALDEYRASQTAPTGLPAPITLTELLAEDTPPVYYRVDKLLPVGGRVVLAAQYKAGKTTLVGNLLRSLADNTPFLGSFPIATAPGNIVLIDNEMPRDTIRSWLAAQTITNHGKVTIIPTRGHISSFDITKESVRQRWIDLIKQYNPSVLILDCLRPVLDALGLEEKSDAGRVLVPLDNIAEETGAKELIVVHHMGHLNERSRGDSRIRDWPDVEWRLVRKDPDNPASERFFTAYGRDVDLPETALSYDTTTRALTLGVGSRLDSAAEALLPDLLALIADQPGQSGRQIEDAVMDTGIPRSTVRRTLAMGVERGLVVTTPGPRRSLRHYPTRVSAPVRRSAPRDDKPLEFA